MASASEMSTSAATLLSTDNIDKHMRGLNRADLLRMLQLDFARPVVGDIEQLHPVTWYAKSTLKVERWNVPWLNEGAAGECCMGALLTRWKHKTATVKCYSTELTDASTVCAHCEQLWAVSDDDGVYELKEDMADAWSRYQKGVRKAFKNWDDMQDVQTFFEREVQTVKDLVAASKFDVEPEWPYMDCKDAIKTFMQQAGVLFPDAGRSQNPYPRTALEQRTIASFVHEMLRLWLRVGATMSKVQWSEHMQVLQRQAKVVAQASRWAVQQQYPNDPVFAGPIMAADIVASALSTADLRFRRMMELVHEDDGTGKLADFSWGLGVEKFVEWAQGITMASTPPLRTKDGPHREDDKETVASRASSQSRTSNKSRSSNRSEKLEWHYAVGRGEKEGVWNKWKEVEPLVIGFSNAIHKKFRSRAAAWGFVKRMKVRDTPVKWWVLKGSLRDGAYKSKVVAQSYQKNGKLLPFWSIPAAKEYLGAGKISIFNETVRRDSTPRRKRNKPDKPAQFFSLRGGTRYERWRVHVST